MTLMTSVVGVLAGGDGGPDSLGEIESAGLSIGWNRATLSAGADAALLEILARDGGTPHRAFELHHGALVLLRCQRVGRSELRFEGSRRRRQPRVPSA
jgi:hypothetical protein